MSTKITKTTSETYSEETVEKTRWEKGWDSRRINQIAAQQEQLSKSISSSAHKQWMTKKDNEIAEKDRKIADLEQQLAELKNKEQQQSEDIFQEIENELDKFDF